MSAVWADGIEAGGEAYVSRLVEQALVAQKLTRESSPEGKKVERIVIQRFDVIDPSDPWPSFVNIFHATTREQVVRRELLFNEDDPWHASVIEETERNLRNNLLVVFATVVPCKGSRPDQVVALVVTKDLWSIRPGITYVFLGSQLVYLDMNLAEYNLVGTRKVVGINLGFDPGTYWLGQQFKEPRLFGSRIAASEVGNLIWNRSGTGIEGGVASVAIEQPLYSLEVEKAWALSLDFRKDVYRLFSQGTIAVFTSPTTGETLPFDYRRRTWDLKLELTDSHGTELKRNLSGGYRFTAGDFQLYETAYQPASLSDFANLFLPRSETNGMFFIKARVFRPAFYKLIDIDQIAMVEDIQLGPDLQLEERIETPLPGLTPFFNETIANLGWSWLWGDDLLQLSAKGSFRYFPGFSPELVNETISLRVRNVSPRLGFFRIHTAARIIRRENDLAHQLEVLGGEGALRGYPQAAFYGPQVWGVNLELRTVPVGYKTVYAGGALFYDMGSTFFTPSQMGFHSSAGVGVRFAFPQFQRAVLRADFAIPLEPYPNATYFVSTFSQAF